MKIAIPSYKRSETISSKTLRYLLEDCNVPPGCVTVFVANTEEATEYRSAIHKDVKIVVGRETLQAQRNFMDFHYTSGEKVLFFDDDVEGLFIKQGEATIPFTNISALYKIGFNECVKQRTALFGICAVNNWFFMSPKISTNLKYIVGCCYGQIITHDQNLCVSLEDKEDFERTILYFHKYKKVVRLNMIAPKTNYYGEEGGMQITRTEDRVTASAMHLIKRFPEYCSMNTKSKSKHTELKLNSRAI